MSVRIMWPPGYPEGRKEATWEALDDRIRRGALGHDSVHAVSHNVNGRETIERWGFAGVECSSCLGRWPTWYLEGHARPSTCPHCEPAAHVETLDSDGRKCVAVSLVRSIEAEPEAPVRRAEFDMLIKALACTSAVDSLHIAWDHAQSLGQTSPERWHNPQDSELIRALLGTDAFAVRDSNLREFFRRYRSALLPHLTAEQIAAIDQALGPTASA